jgi:predicted regulator of Ras-like GTPase activity (Roadblock/LC7/MglB family)
VTDFRTALRALADAIPETRLLIIMGTDGIPVEKVASSDDPVLEAVAAETTTLLRDSVAAAQDTGLGALRELTLSTDRLHAHLTAITPEYFLFGAFAPGVLLGRARHLLRRTAATLEQEFL